MLPEHGIRRWRLSWAVHWALRRWDIAGLAAFGIGWGVAGSYPGGALPAIGTLDPAILTFTGAMIAGIVIFKAVKSRSQPLGHTV